MRDLDVRIARAARLVAESRYTVALTGAGISVPSGIPDFRSPRSGLWTMVDPFEVASLRGFLTDPARFYDWIRPLALTVAEARPNPAHLALARLQELGRLGPIITQNMDGLHEAAGSRDVLAVHGHTRTGTCTACLSQIPGERLWDSVRVGELPLCECGNVVKPDVVLFGEVLPSRILEQAEKAAREARVMLVVGSSLEVYPVAGLPHLTHQAGGEVIIVNLGPTGLDDIATIKIEADVAQAIPAIVDQVAATPPLTP